MVVSVVLKLPSESLTNSTIGKPCSTFPFALYPDFRRRRIPSSNITVFGFIVPQNFNPSRCASGSARASARATTLANLFFTPVKNPRPWSRREFLFSIYIYIYIIYINIHLFAKNPYVCLNYSICTFINFILKLSFLLNLVIL